ncbi:MAG: trimethylamine methyltransferase family protein, partial [Butyricicoccus sp.]
ISKKHIWIQPYEARNVRCLIDVVQAAAGGADKLREKPFVSFIACSVPLLGYKYMDAEVLYRCAKAGIPVQPCSLPTAGANTPVTAQGTALVSCAEVLAQIVMLELLCPGLPVIATTLLFSMDMKSTCTLQSCPEITLGRLMCMQLFHEGYGIMAHSYGTGTDSAVFDAQNFIERTQLIHMMAMSDADVLGGAGQLDTARTNSPLQLIIDNEIFGTAQRLRQGLTVDDEMFDWEELMGDPEDLEDGFIVTEHTLRHYADATRPALFNRGGILSLDRTEGKDPVLARFEEILANPDVMERSPENLAAIEAAVARAAETLIGKERETA